MEAALAIASLVAVLLLCLAGLAALSTQVRCIDAAREAARLAARGGGRAVIAARAVAPGAAVDLRHDGGYVRARVSTRSPGLALFPGFAVAAEAVAALEH